MSTLVPPKNKMADKYPKLPPRGIKMLRLYESGQTLEEIGTQFNVTRERVRQIIRKAAVLELAGLYGMDAKNKEVNRSLNRQVDFLFHQIKTARKETKLEDEVSGINTKIDEALTKGIRPENFISLSLYSKYSGVKESELKDHRPDIVEKILNNKRRRWSWYYAQCRSCGTVSVKHHSLGYCENCYPKSPEFKEMQMNSYHRNYDNRVQYNKKYAKKYYHRPEVKSRILNRAFDGNREKAIQKDGFQCTECGLSRTQSQQKYGKDLYVKRIDGDNANNCLSNLKTVCKSCFDRGHRWGR